MIIALPILYFKNNDMIVKKEVFIAYCDHCGASLMYDDVEMCYDTEEDVKNAMGWSEWEWVDDKVYCDDCIREYFEYDEENDTYRKKLNLN